MLELTTCHEVVSSSKDGATEGQGELSSNNSPVGNTPPKCHFSRRPCVLACEHINSLRVMWDLNFKFLLVSIYL